MATQVAGQTAPARKSLDEISRGEWVQVLAWSAVILLVTSLPYLYGAFISTPQSRFGGLVVGLEDGNAYLAKMNLGASGSWKFYLFYTSEPHEGAYLYMFHLVLGKLARAAGLSFVLIFHLARVLGGLFLLASVYRFTAFFTEIRPVRQLAFWLVAVGGGLGWLALLLGLGDELGLPLDFYSPDAFIFHALMALPHLSLGAGLLLWAIVLVWRAWETGAPSYALLAGLALIGVVAAAPLYIAIPAVVTALAWLLRWWQRRNPNTHPGREAGPAFRRDVGLALLAFGMAGLPALHSAYVFATNPFFQVWFEANRLLSPAPVHYLLAFGPLALLAVAGLWGERRGTHPLSERRLLLMAWLAAVPIMVYIPFNSQRRFSLGVQVALAICAALAMWRLLGSQAARRRWRLAAVGLVTLLSLTNVVLLVGAGLEVHRRSPLLFRPGAVVDAADWLAARVTPDQVVLAAYETGNYLPTRGAARVFAGHNMETLHLDEKRARLARFFGDGSDAFRRQLLHEHGIDYVFYGPAERALGAFDPGQASYLRQVYDDAGVQIYQVLIPDD